MKKTLTIISLLLTCLALVRCSQDSESRDFSDSYQYKVNGCDTGKMVFQGSSAEEVKQMLCDALRDDELNNYCAYEMRLSRYKVSCM